MTWTDERVETLKTMWADGKSASQIAKELGGITRNAVIGKVHRLGLSNRIGGPGLAEEGEILAHDPDPAVDLQASSPEAPPVTAQRPAEPAAEQASAPPRAKPAQVLPPVQPPMAPPGPSEISPEALANLAEVERKAKRLSLMQLTERTCKWPVGDPATDDFWFCGLPATPGKPYCEAHVAVAFQPMSSRRDRRAGSR
jgi:GcrA cell cycle regulator